MPMDKDEARRRADAILQANAKQAPNYDKFHQFSLPMFYRTHALKQRPFAMQAKLIEQAIAYVDTHTVFGYLKFLYMLNAVLVMIFLVGSHNRSSMGAIGVKILLAITMCLWVARIIKTRAYIDQVLLPRQ